MTQATPVPNDAALVANAVVDRLNAEAFDPPFTAVKSYLPERELTDASLRVEVVPAAVRLGPHSRTRLESMAGITVGIRQKVNPADLLTLDRLAALSQAITAHFQRDHGLPSVPATLVELTAMDPLYHVEILEQYRQWLSVIDLTFKLTHRTAPTDQET